MQYRSHRLHVALIGVLVVGALSLSACQSTPQPQARIPADLVKLDNDVSVLSPVLKHNLAQGGGRLFGRTAVNTKDTPDLKVAKLSTGFVAVSRSGVVSVYGDDGKLLWSLDTQEATSSGVAVDKDGTTLVVGGRFGKVVAIDVASRSVRWQANLPSASLTPSLIASGRVMVSANDGVIYALDSKTGKQVWQFNTQTPSVSVRGIAQPILIDEQTALFGTADGRIHAISPATGRPLWRRLVGQAVGGSQVHRMSDVDGQPLVVGHHLYIASYSGQLLGFDMSTGQGLFASQLSSIKSLTALGSLLVGASVNGDVVAFDRITGQELWKNSELKYRKLTNPVAIGSHVAVGDLEGFIHVFDNTGKIISRVQTTGQLISLQVHDNKLYAQSTDDVVAVWQFKQ